MAMAVGGGLRARSLIGLASRHTAPQEGSAFTVK
jgi:hypothetical protein